MHRLRLRVCCRVRKTRCATRGGGARLYKTILVSKRLKVRVSDRKSPLLYVRFAGLRQRPTTWTPCWSAWISDICSSALPLEHVYLSKYRWWIQNALSTIPDRFAFFLITAPSLVEELVRGPCRGPRACATGRLAVSHWLAEQRAIEAYL